MRGQLFRDAEVGVWYATAPPTKPGGSAHLVSQVTVRSTKGKIYARFPTR
ncbi:hypothetical protein ACWDBT_08805 [Streptomyces ardesiacus]